MAERKKLPAKWIGKEFCERWRGPLGDLKNVKICVKGVNYGFLARLDAGRGGHHPIPTDESQTPKAALRSARNFLLRAHFDDHGNLRGPRTRSRRR